MSARKNSVRLPLFRAPEPAMALTVVPPFPFEGMTTRSFPLRASLDALQRFCDSYLNIIPPELGRFRVMAPYVQLMLVDYGKMAVKIRNVGWMAQREILFSVPVEWYRVVDGEWQFQDWATFAPFIYVDDDMSMNTGRTVYGWPKTIAKLTPTLSEWIRDPIAPVREASASTMVFPELYRGSKLASRTFLEVERGAPMSNVRIPFDEQSELAPWTVASRLADAFAGFSRDAVGLLQGMGVWPMHDGTSTDNYIAMMGKATAMGFPPRPNVRANTLNLKQFRRSEAPELFCYQALTNGPMTFTAFNEAGLLGEERMLLGDVTGGYRIRLYEWPSLPIVETLGLEVARRWRGEECNVVELKPVVPFWYNVNMEYQPGRVIAWRARDDEWRDAEGRTYLPPERTKFEQQTDKYYVTSLGASQAAVSGPFTFTDTTIRVLPLLADQKRLEVFLDEYLNRAVGPDHRFRLWAAKDSPSGHGYVYATVTSFGDVTSHTNNIGDWANLELAYLVPVCVEQRKADDTWELCSVGLIPAMTFVDTVTAAAAGSEVLGIPTLHATFVEPESVWMQAGGPAPDVLQTLLRVDAEVEPVVGEGQKTEMRTIAVIAEGQLPDDAEGLGWRITADRWAAMLRQELARKKRTKEKLSKNGELKHARALALDLLGNRTPLSVFTLKQFRDVTDPTRACYQSLVLVRRTLNEVLDMREIEQPITLRIYEYPTYPVVELLGLVSKQLVEPGGGIVHAIQPIRPFWMRVTMEEALGERVLSRARTNTWTQADSKLGKYFTEEYEIAVGAGVSTMQDQGDPRRMAKTALDWKTWGHAREGQRHVSQKEAAAAVHLVDPQVVLETILSREWGNWSEHSRWREGRRKLEAQLREQLSGVPVGGLALAEASFFEAAVKALGNRPGQPPVPAKDAEEMHASLKDFQADQLLVEQRWERVTQLMSKSRMVNKKRLGDAMKALCAVLESIATHKIAGEPSSGDRRANYSPHEDKIRLLELLKISLDPDHESIESLRRSCREAVELARRRCLLQREALLNMLSKGWQKPDFVVRRDSAGPDRERLFPRAESWDDEWYVGPPLRP